MTYIELQVPSSPPFDKFPLSSETLLPLLLRESLYSIEPLEFSSFSLQFGTLPSSSLVLSLALDYVRVPPDLFPLISRHPQAFPLILFHFPFPQHTPGGKKCQKLLDLPRILQKACPKDQTTLEESGRPFQAVQKCQRLVEQWYIDLSPIEDIPTHFYIHRAGQAYQYIFPRQICCWYYTTESEIV